MVSLRDLRLNRPFDLWSPNPGTAAFRSDTSPGVAVHEVNDLDRLGWASPGRGQDGEEAGEED